MSFLEMNNSKNNHFNIQEIIDFIYFENFNDILIEEKSKFISNIENRLIDVLNRQNQNFKLNNEKQNALIEKEKIKIIHRYEKDYLMLNNELIKYEKNQREVQYLTHFRKHCIDLNHIPSHKCSEDKIGKFIEVFEENKRKYLPKRSKEKPLYVICTGCHKCYFADFIKIFCSCCKEEYFSSKLEEKENENILPATWKEYHCKPIIVNETMKCIKCENVLYINLYNKKLVCLNTKCNFVSESKSIIWKCKFCHKDFTSTAKIFNPLENKILQNTVFNSLLNKEICVPQKLYCCCLIRRNNKYTHNKKCNGELYKGFLNKNQIVVCSKCHAVNYYEKFIWTCPLCNIKFYYNGKKYKKDIPNMQSHKLLYSIEKYQNLDLNKNKAQRNLSSNIRVYFNNNFEDKNKKTLENDNSKNLLYNKNTFDSAKKHIEEENNEDHNLSVNDIVPRFKYLKRKKNLRYKTLYDILKEKKNQRNVGVDEVNNNYDVGNKKYNDKINMNDYSYEYGIREEKIDDEKPENAIKNIKDRKNLIQNYIYRNDIVVNININSSNVKNSNNLINISNISNSEKILQKKDIFEKIDENPNENYVYEYESIRKSLQKKYWGDSKNINKISLNDKSRNIDYSSDEKNNNFKIPFKKDKNRDISDEKYKLIYNRHLTINDNNKIDEDENEGRETTFYNKKNLRKKFFKESKSKFNNTINAEIPDNNLNQKNNEKKSEKKFYRKYIGKEKKVEEYNEDKNNNITNNNIQKYRSSRFKQNKFYKKLFLNKDQSNTKNNNNNNIPLDNIPELDNSIPISPFGDIGSSIISRDDFLKISRECKIPSYDENNISYIRPIGQGSYGVIYLVEEKNKKIQYALKSILCNDLEQILKHKKEFELSYSLSHTNFIKIYNALFKYLDMTTYMLYILMERGETDWNTEIEKRAKLNNFYTETELIKILKQLTDVLYYFQKNNIAHRDIKPQNILVFKNGIYKITDLGEAKDAKKNIQLATLKGSQYFMSPNLFFAFKYNGSNHKVVHNIFKSDVFSLGFCFLYAMNLNMKLIQSLREENNMKNVVNVVKRFGLDKKYSDKFMNIIYNMIQIDENKRWDFIELNEEVNKNFK